MADGFIAAPSSVPSPVNGGLLAGAAAANAITAGFQTYMQRKDINDRKARENQYMQMAMAQHGLQQDPDTGEIKMSPFAQAKQAASLQESGIQAPGVSSVPTDGSRNPDEMGGGSSGGPGSPDSGQGLLDYGGGYTETPEHAATRQAGLLKAQKQVEQLSPESQARVGQLYGQGAKLMGLNAPQGTTPAEYEEAAGFLEKAGGVQATKNNRQNTVNEKAYADANNVATGLQKDKNWVQFENQATKGDEILKKIDSAKSNQAEAATIPTELGNYISGGQRLHSQTIDSLGGPQAAIDKINSMFQKVGKGTITDTQAKYLADMVSRIKSDAVAGQQGLEDGASTRYANIKSKFGAQISPDDASQLIFNRPLRNSQAMKQLGNGGGMMGPQKPANVPDADWNALSPAGQQRLVDHIGR